jgi:manganese efflux pump family protein
MYLTIFLLGIGLSMDAFAVSISGGLSCRKVSLKDTLRLSFTFGFFQALMPFLGYHLGSLFSRYIDSFDHYIAFALLLGIGIKMIYEGSKKEKARPADHFFSSTNILLLGVATSMDAFIAGLGLSMTKALILPAIAIIGAVTFTFSVMGVKLGCRLGERFEKAADILGGSILIILGLKILLEGLSVF